jgi:uncharacterized membrane protein YobD (UPF0266 family)
MVHIKFVGIFMTYLHTQFHMSSSNGSLVISIKLTDKDRLNAAAILFCIIQKAVLINVCVLEIYYHTKFQDSTLSGVSVSHIS